MRNLLLTIAAVLLLGPAALAAEAVKAAGPQVAISVARDVPGAPARVGEAVALRVTLRNSSGRPLTVPDWDLFADETAVTVRITGYPGESGKAEETPASWDRTVFQKGDFRALAPGDTAVLRTFVPLLPGQARVTAGFHSPADSYASLTDGKVQKVDGAWVGHVYASTTIDVPAEMSAEMTKRYEEVRVKLADPLVPAEQKGRLLAIMADEKHYFAARFIREQCESLPAGPLRDAATWQLLKLAKAGTAYQWIPLLLTQMVDPNVQQQIRVAIMEWAVESLAAKGRLAIADQAVYVWPDAVQKQAREQLQKLTEDRNPYLAAKAKELIGRL